MSKLSRRDFLKQIGTMPFMAIPLIGVLSAKKILDPEFIEVFVESKGWNVARLGETDSSSVGYVRVNSDGTRWTFVDIPDLRIEKKFIEAYTGENGQVVGWDVNKLSYKGSLLDG